MLLTRHRNTQGPVVQVLKTTGQEQQAETLATIMLRPMNPSQATLLKHGQATPAASVGTMTESVRSNPLVTLRRRDEDPSATTAGILSRAARIHLSGLSSLGRQFATMDYLDYAETRKFFQRYPSIVMVEELAALETCAVACIETDPESSKALVHQALLLQRKMRHAQQPELFDSFITGIITDDHETIDSWKIELEVYFRRLKTLASRKKAASEAAGATSGSLAGGRLCKRSRRTPSEAYHAGY